MADPARVGVRVSMPAVFYVPGTNSAKVGPSYGDGPVLSFANGVALASKGWTFATFDDVEKTLTCPDGTVGADVGPANQDRISGPPDRAGLLKLLQRRCFTWISKVRRTEKVGDVSAAGFVLAILVIGAGVLSSATRPTPPLR
jgi:hypothetical protein